MGEILTLDNFRVLILHCIRLKLCGYSTGLASRPMTCGLLIIQTNKKNFHYLLEISFKDGLTVNF